MAKEVFGNGSIRLELYEEEDKNWLQNGIAGLWMKDQELADLIELIIGLTEDEDMDDDYMELGDSGLIATEGLTIDKKTKEVVENDHDKEDDSNPTREGESPRS